MKSTGESLEPTAATRVRAITRLSAARCDGYGLSRTHILDSFSFVQNHAQYRDNVILP